jgi:hypothetical protein
MESDTGCSIHSACLALREQLASGYTRGVVAGCQRARTCTKRDLSQTMLPRSDGIARCGAAILLVSVAVLVFALGAGVAAQPVPTTGTAYYHQG